jgi:hypothetical protein
MQLLFTYKKKEVVIRILLMIINISKGLKVPILKRPMGIWTYVLPPFSSFFFFFFHIYIYIYIYITWRLREKDGGLGESYIYIYIENFSARAPRV